MALFLGKTLSTGVGKPTNLVILISSLCSICYGTKWVEDLNSVSKTFTLYRFRLTSEANVFEGRASSIFLTLFGLGQLCVMSRLEGLKLARNLLQFFQLSGMNMNLKIIASVLLVASSASAVANTIYGNALLARDYATDYPEYPGHTPNPVNVMVLNSLALPAGPLNAFLAYDRVTPGLSPIGDISANHECSIQVCSSANRQ